MTKKIIPSISLMLMFSLAVEAQQTTDGRKVQRITFDRERVIIEYSDGTKDYDVDAATIKRDDTTDGVVAVRQNGSKTGRQLYTIDGRSVQGEPRQKGVFIERSKNGIKKTIKK